MGELSSRTATGGALGDTFLAKVVAKVFADGVYGFVSKALLSDLFDPSADLNSRRVIGSGEGQAADGYATRVATNGLLYEVREGAYAVVDYQIDIASVAVRNGLTEMETGQRVRIDSEGGRVDSWDGTAWVEGLPETMLVALYEDVPNPTTVRVGTSYRVTNDPEDGLNGVHVAMGAAPGENAKYWDASN